MSCTTIAEIRQAIASEEFALAERLWNQYAGQLRQAITDRTATGAMLSETRQLIDWSALVVRAFRAHAMDRLNSASLGQMYSRPTPEPYHMVRASF
jgi:hypothetical protein